MPNQILTHDERKAAEAAYRGLPCDPNWSAAAKTVYEGMAKAIKASEEQALVIAEEAVLSATR